jgi:hypothetical protein
MLEKVKRCKKPSLKKIKPPLGYSVYSQAYDLAVSVFLPLGPAALIQRVTRAQGATRSISAAVNKSS